MHRNVAVVFICVFVLCLSVFKPSQAFAGVITIDFHSVLPGELIGLGEPGVYFDVDGFRISVVRGHYDVLDVPPEERFLHLDTYAGGGSTVRLQSLSGARFDFLGFEVLYWRPNPDESPLDEVAFVTSSEAGYAEITSAGWLSLQGSPWQGITWAEFSVRDPNYFQCCDTRQDNLGLDNIRIRVAEPATLTLLGLGAAGAFVRRATRLRRFLAFAPDHHVNDGDRNGAEKPTRRT